MALLASEIARIRMELGYNVMGLSAEPYIGVTAIFNSVIQNYISAGASTTSATPVTAADTPTPTSIVLADGTDVSAGDVVVVDVDTRQERATVQSKSGNTITVQLSKAHVGTYPVTVEGGEALVREILGVLRGLAGGGMNGLNSALAKATSRAGIKKVDEVEFFGGGSARNAEGIDPLTAMIKMREYWRDELAMTLGVERLNARGGGSVTTL